MYFGFDDEQLAFRDAVRDLLEKECGPAVVRAAWHAPPGRLSRDVWERLAQMGVLAALLPEDAGGLGLDERSLVLVLEETGRAGLPHPIVDTALVALPVAGHRVVERTDGAPLIATDLGGPNVACAGDADLLLLHERRAAGGPPGELSSGSLHLVDPRHDGVALEPLDTVDGARRAARVSWQPQPETLVTDDPAEVGVAYDRGAFAAAAQLIGLGQRMLEETVAYVSDRHQFGKPVGSFQAVKHQLADALKELAFARPAVHRAAHSLAVGDTTQQRDVSMAKAMASDAARFVGRRALQCHGAIGYTVEADLHLYLKRTWALASAWGDAAWHRTRVGHAIGMG
jgi:alkylation response protein AidB-like acyl-CoA dehydrogenase